MTYIKPWVIINYLETIYMINKKSILLLFVSLIVICLTISAVSAAEGNSTDGANTQQTEIQKMVNVEKTDTVRKAKMLKVLQHTTLQQMENHPTKEHKIVHTTLQPQ